MNDPTPNFDDVRSADPVRLADLPTASSPAAQELLTNTMSTRAVVAPTKLRNRLPVLGAVAAAVALIATSFALLSPGNTDTALASVKAAAQEAAVADSGRIITSFSIDGNIDGTTDTAAGEVEVLFNRDDLAITLDVSDVPDELQSERTELLEGVETRLVDGVLYVRGGPAPEWVALELPQLFIDEITKVDPRTLLQSIQTLVDAEEIGTDTVDGDAVTLYRSIVDLNDPSLSSSGWMAGLESQLDLETDGTIVVEMAVDGSDQLRRVNVTGDLTAAQDGDGSATFSISTVFADLNNVDRIVAPEGVVPNSMLDGLLEADDN